MTWFATLGVAVLEVAAGQSDTIPVWYLLYPLALAVLCALNAILPRRMWGLFKSWKYRNPETVEPSDLVVAWYRFTGVVGAIALTGLAVWMFVTMRQEAACNEVMAELTELYGQGSADAVEQRAEELGMEVEELTGTSRVAPYGFEITQDGETIGFIRPQIDDWTCDPAPSDDT
jgi:hypothetical protein